MGALVIEQNNQWEKTLWLYGSILKGKFNVQTKAVFLLFGMFIDKHDGLAGEIPSLNK